VLMELADILSALCPGMLAKRKECKAVRRGHTAIVGVGGQLAAGQPHPKSRPGTQDGLEHPQMQLVIQIQTGPQGVQAQGHKQQTAQSGHGALVDVGGQLAPAQHRCARADGLAEQAAQRYSVHIGGSCQADGCKLRARTADRALGTQKAGKHAFASAVLKCLADAAP